MIEVFRTWLPAIIGYGEAVENGVIQRAWANGDRSQTSAYYSGELYEQVFDDLASDSMLEDAQRALGTHSVSGGDARTFPVVPQATGRVDRWSCPDRSLGHETGWVRLSLRRP